MNKHRIVGIGELLWDIFPDGKQLGGAPLNFSYHALQSGNDVFVVSAIGNDDLGNEILKKLHHAGIDHTYIQIHNKQKTGMVTVKIDDKGIPDYTIHTNVAWDVIKWEKKFKTLAEKADAVCFGTIAQRNEISRQTIRRFLRSTSINCLRVFDINLRQSFYNYDIINSSLEFANILKLNEEELQVMIKYYTLSGDIEKTLMQLMDAFNLKMIACTKGSQGSILATPLEISLCEAPKIAIADTVGAGDAYTAALVNGILNKDDVKTIHKKATNIAAYVCTQIGATPEMPKDLYN